MPTIVVRTPVGYVPAEVGDPGDGLVQTRRLRVTRNSFSNAGPFPGTNVVNVGSMLPPNTLILGSAVLVTTAFTPASNPQITLGFSGGTGVEIGTAPFYDLASVDTYVTDNATLAPAATQVVATFTNAAAVLGGSGEIVIRFLEL